MVILPKETGLDTPIELSHISAIIVQIKNRTDDARLFTNEYIKEQKFDVRHIEGLDKSISYVGIWMSFRATPDDFTVEGLDIPLTIKLPCESLPCN
jgi:hypothetical protein